MCVLRTWILYDWAADARTIPIDSEGGKRGIEVVNWYKSTTEPDELERQWNGLFPRYSFAGEAYVRADVNEGWNHLWRMRGRLFW